MTDTPKIEGELALQPLAMPKDTNANGDIFGGWLVSQMDLAAGIVSRQETGGRSVTVAIESVSFLKPVKVGATVSCYCRVVKRGRTSVHIAVDVWSWQQVNHDEGIRLPMACSFLWLSMNRENRDHCLRLNLRTF